MKTPLFVLSAALVEVKHFLYGTRHRFMVFERKRLAIPSNEEYTVPQLLVLIREIEAILGRSLDPEEWASR